VARPTKTVQRRQAILARAEAVVRERYSEVDLSLADVAKDVGTSPRQLQRVFRELGDTDFRSALLRVRVERAHRLLSRKKHNLTVQATARSVGYRQASGLRQAFVRYYGHAPSEIQPREPDYSDLWREVEQSG
jgi:transcriptional regulator GlxA family with amidase domain